MASERFHDPDKWGSQKEMLRALMILHNLEDSPFFFAFVEFFRNGDKYELGRKWPGGIDAYLDDATVREAKEIAGFIPSYNAEQRLTGLRQFKIYRYLKETENA